MKYVNDSLYLGFCFSSNCSATDFNNNRQFIIDSINASLQQVGKPLPAVFNVASLAIMNPYTYEPNRGALFYVVLIITLGLIMLSTVYPALRAQKGD